MPTVIERPFTLLVGGRPILSFVASTFTEANELTREEWLRADLLKYRSNDEPLWDGTAKLSVRVSHAEEKAAFEQGLKETAADDGMRLSTSLSWTTPNSERSPSSLASRKKSIPFGEICLH